MEVSKHVEKAEEALRKKNFDYAAQLLQQVLSLKPDHGEAYRVLCQAFRQKHERKPTPSWLAKVAGSPFLLSAGVSRLTRNHAGRARALTKYLKLEPTNPHLAMSLGDSLAEAGFLNSAVSVFASLGEASPKEGGAWRAAAECQARLKKTEDVLESLEKALAANPRDAEAERMRKNLAAAVTLHKGTYDKAASSRDLMKDQDQAKRLERQQRIHKSAEEIAEEEEDLKAALSENPKDGRARRRLADILTKRHDHDGAIETLLAGRDHDDNIGDLDDKVGDLRIGAIQREIRKLETRLKEKPSDNLREDLEALQNDRRALEIEEFQRRVKDRPTDLSLWYVLGKALHESGRLDDAVGAFQKSVKDPKTRLDSLVRLGSCFHEKGLFDLADKQLTAALEETSATSEKGKSILYNLGLIAEQADRKDEAFQYFTRVYEIDINYRDVGAKIEALRPS